jgi:Gpi18-like mannosyltransferase
LRWDAVCYLIIAEAGYTAQPGLTVWPPLYPGLIRVFALVFQPPILAALVISGLATWLLFTLLYILAAENQDEGIAKNTLFLYVIYPASFFLVSGYTESIFLLLVVAGLLSAKRGYWGWAGIFSALAALTRLQGIFLAPALFCEALLQYKERQEKSISKLFINTVISAAPVLAFGAFSLYIHYYLKADWPWQTLADLWGQYTGFPWEGIFGNINRLSTLTTSTDLYWLPTTIIDLIFALLVPMVLALKFRSMRLSFAVYAWAMLLVSLTKLGPDDILVSASRYALTIFPFFIALAPAMENKYARLIAFTFGIISQGILMYMFYIWSWAG